MSKVSAVVLTQDEERHLPACLASLPWADEVLVLDSGSTDRTRDIAQGAGARVVLREFTNFGDQRQAALELATYDWIFFVDADERVPPELADEVQDVITENCLEVGWWVPRRNFFWGHEVQHTGWAPDYQLRLIHRDHARYDETEVVHEVAHLEGPDGYLQTPLIHLNYESWDEFFTKQRAYASYEARRRLVEGRRVRIWTFVLQPARAFWRRFIAWKGYKDGRLGLLLSLAMAWFELLVCRRLWQLQDVDSRSS